MKILCPSHPDSNPSMEVYEDFGYCFVCSALIPIKDINLPGSHTRVQKPKEDIQATLEYIRDLPVKVIRGLPLPYDDQGYFITWPNANFYKRRNWYGKVRYTGPRGFKPPLYSIPGKGLSLNIVEGELNALSLYTATGVNVISPGSATELPRLASINTDLIHINIFVDRDAPGIINGNKLKQKLLKRNYHVSLIPMSDDFNTVLEIGGAEAVKRSFERLTTYV